MPFNLTEVQMNKFKSRYTANEIRQQPITWDKTMEQMLKIRTRLKKFIDKVLVQDDYDIILTGAGTSEYIGNAASTFLNKILQYRVKSYATTDIIATPESYLSSRKPTLLVSFARSGDSPESVGAVQAADTLCMNVYHLIITCNEHGALAKTAETHDNCFCINLASETHDQSFAMTSSFTNMYLAVLCVFQLDTLDNVTSSIRDIIKSAEQFLAYSFGLCKEIVDSYDFNRIVYLGSNTLKGFAQESSLKMLELTAGIVVSSYETPLGFRHGPKSIVNNRTLTVFFLSDISYTREYEVDLLKEMKAQQQGNKICVIENHHSDTVKEMADYYYAFNNRDDHDNCYLGLNYILCAQLLAFYKSLSLGNTPDDPCQTGVVNRVVKGVRIYPYGK